jgi:hypothetical protein
MEKEIINIVIREAKLSDGSKVCDVCLRGDVKEIILHARTKLSAYRFAIDIQEAIRQHTVDEANIVE